MTKIVSRLLTLLILTTPAFSQYVTVHAKLTDPSGSVPASAFLQFELRNCGDNFPVVSTTNTVVSNTVFDLKPSQPDGSILGQVYGNDAITCGSVASTFYHVTAMKNQTTPYGPPEDFVICGATGPTCYPGTGNTWELVQAQPMVDPPGIPGFTFIVGNPKLNQSITQPSGTSFSWFGTVDFSGATVLGLPGGGGGGGTPAQPVNAVQFNQSGAFGGSANFTWNNSTNLLTVGVPSPNSGLISLLNSGVFTTAKMNEYSTALVNGITTAGVLANSNQFYKMTNAVVGGVAVPVGATTVTNNGVLGEATTLCNSASRTVCNAVGVSGFGQARASNSAAWGMNPSAADAAGLTGTSLNGVEVDMGVSGSPAYVRGVSTTLNPAFLSGVPGTMPADSVGYELGGWNSGGLLQWNTGFRSDPGAVGAAGHGLLLDATATSGASVGSQTLAFGYFDAGSVHHQTDVFYANGTGSLNINSTGIANNSQAIKHIRVGSTLGGSCPTAASVGATCTGAAIVWSSPFADNNYTLTCTLDVSTNQPHIVSETHIAAQFQIKIAADTAAAADAGVDCIAIHD